MFQWQMFKQTYTDFKTLRDQNDGKNNSDMFKALVCPAEDC